MATDTELPALPDAAAVLGLDIPEECLPGVIANLDALADHLRILESPDPAAEPRL